MIWVLGVVLLLWLAFGPWILVAAVAALLVPRARWWLQDRLRWSPRISAYAAGAVALLVSLVVVVPDGALPIPSSPGRMAVPSYIGRPATAEPVAAQPAPQHPQLARNGASGAHSDAWGTDAVPWAGPLGLQPEVDTGWFGREQCADLAFDTRDRVVAVCSDPDGPTVHVIDAETMRKSASLVLPDREEGRERRGERLCGGTHFFLDARDRAVVVTTERQVEAIRTANGKEEPDLTVDQSWDLRPYVPDGDCLVGLLPDWAGRIWWVSLGGLVGTIAPDSGEIRVHDLGERVYTSLAVDETGGVYVVSDRAVQRLSAAPDGAPRVDWRTTYDRGNDPKPGQVGRGSGTAPTLLDGGVVAFADDAEPRTNVVFLDGASGAEICRRPVFEDDASATDTSLVSLGTGVVVTNSHGYRGVFSTALGLATEAGLSRVDVAGGECRTRWTSDQVAPSSGAKASWASGLVYAYTKRPTWTGVSAWYVSALDVDSGRTMWSVRTGTGMSFNNHRARLAIAPDASVWIATLAGLVRVRDRR